MLKSSTESSAPLKQSSPRSSAARGNVLYTRRVANEAITTTRLSGLGFYRHLQRDRWGTSLTSRFCCTSLSASGSHLRSVSVQCSLQRQSNIVAKLVTHTLQFGPGELCPTPNASSPCHRAQVFNGLDQSDGSVLNLGIFNGRIHAPGQLVNPVWRKVFVGGKIKMERPWAGQGSSISQGLRNTGKADEG